MSTYYFSGKAMWAEVTDVNKYGKYAVKLIVDEQAAKEFEAIGSKSTPKQTDDGSWQLSFTRDPSKDVYVNGKKQKAGPLEVIDADGNPYEGKIGNGSDVTLKITVFKWDNAYGKGVGVRIDKVRVDTLVPYGASQVAGGNVGDNFQPF